jgi:hypothetical protein
MTRIDDLAWVFLVVGWYATAAFWCSAAWWVLRQATL